MKTYEVIGRFVQFGQGRLKLTPEQSKPREHALSDLGDGVFEIMRPVEFKCGEHIEYEGEVAGWAADVLSERGGTDEAAAIAAAAVQKRRGKH